MITFKVGILGTGKMAKTAAQCLNNLSGFTPFAVASRDAEKASGFAAENEIEKSYGSYDELIADPDIELVYIATVNSIHAELAKKCIEAGKPCLVEAPFSYNLKTTREVIELAKEKNVFCAEALWTRYMPITIKFQEIISKNIIGPVRHVTANLGYELHNEERISKPELAGGVLLNLASYPIAMVLTSMGQMPANMAPAITKLNTGVDAIDNIQLNFPNARTASVFATMTYNSDNKLCVYGTSGRIELDNVQCPEKITIFGPNGEPAQTILKPDKQESGYEYEFLSSRDAIITGKIETIEHQHSNIIQLASLMEAIRYGAGVTFPLPDELTKEEIEKRFQSAKA